MNKILAKAIAMPAAIALICLAGACGFDTKASAPVPATAATQTTTIYLVRHGETTANVMHRAQGWSDFTLTQNGVDGAKYLGKGLKDVKFAAAYSGDLTRQEKTANGALEASGNKNVKLQIDPRLRECNYGSYEGLPDQGQAIPAIAQHFGYANAQDFMKGAGNQVMSKMQEGYYELDQANSLQTNLPAQFRAEKPETVENRMSAALTQIGKKQGDKGGNVLVVSSGMSISLFLEAQKIPNNAGPLKNDSVTKLTYKNGKFTLVGGIGSLKYYNAGKKAA
ncbi:histidine phosphatase family protein [Bifidobacterium sp. ESL0769]|uniref:histidine phosphatase family protein n=1 Tax=Bifidobacterium sp. ESL0769 TaxID=2983229 RepID=UPI0023F86F79|nr:histidine phosphatase family protein [Bifidobacterium sp. ESL0769]WEV67510.1 histidine phosphatase family protein [Bifidobacterium sp. ESL0769]